MHKSPSLRTGQKAAELIRYYGRQHRGKPDDHLDLPYRITTSGAWATSRPGHLFHFFRSIGLHQFRLFVDLGSGDGIVSCLAGLFTNSIGIEADPRLVSRARRAARDLNLEQRVDFIRADFLTQNIRGADCLYIYPDKPVYALEENLKSWRGTLLIYGPHFPPKKLLLKQKLKCGRETLSVYQD